MLTWAMAWLIYSGKLDNGIHLVIAMVGDVMIVYHIASIFTQGKP